MPGEVDSGDGDHVGQQVLRCAWLSHSLPINAPPPRHSLTAPSVPCVCRTSQTTAIVCRCVQHYASADYAHLQQDPDSTRVLEHIGTVGDRPY